MAPKKNIEDDLAAFIDATPKNLASGRGGRRCSTCSSARVTEINRAIVSFNEKKAEGVTTMSWAFFSKNFLAKKFGHEVDWRAILRHAENCLGLEIVR